jgi:hypothetical protein
MKDPRVRAVLVYLLAMTFGFLLSVTFPILIRGHHFKERF